LAIVVSLIEGTITPKPKRKAPLAPIDEPQTGCGFSPELVEEFCLAASSAVTSDIFKW